MSFGLLGLSVRCCKVYGGGYPERESLIFIFELSHIHNLWIDVPSGCRALNVLLDCDGTHNS
jgi:hypothetical protein